MKRPFPKSAVTPQGSGSAFNGSAGGQPPGMSSAQPLPGRGKKRTRRRRNGVFVAGAGRGNANTGISRAVQEDMLRSRPAAHARAMQRRS